MHTKYDTMDSDSIYLPTPDFSSPWGLDILGAGFASIKPHEEYPPRQHPTDHYFEWHRGRRLSEFQLLFISSGSGILETEASGIHHVRSPSLFILFPEVWHRYRPSPDTGWREYWVAFRGEFVIRFIELGELKATKPVFEVGHHELLLAQMQLIQDEARREAFGFRRVCATATMQMLALATSLPDRRIEEKEPMRSTIRHACFLLRENVDKSLSVEALAEQLEVGYTYFRRLFKRYTGISPKRYHNALRLARAKNLLRDTTLNLSEIADAMSFDSPFHFSSWFKKATGQPPSRWRENPIPEENGPSMD